MKKVIFMPLLTGVSFLACCMFFLTLNYTTTFSPIDELGDKEELHDVSFEVKMFQEGTIRKGLLNMNFSNGKSNHKMQNKMEHPYDLDLSYLTTNYVVMDKDKETFHKEIASRQSSEGDCGQNSYEIMNFKELTIEHYWYEIGEFKLNSNLIWKKHDESSILVNSCSEHQILHVEEYGIYSPSPIVLKTANGKYYTMPTTTKAVSGTNAIHEIENKVLDTTTRETKLKQKVLTQLPTNRVYHQMILVEEQLVVNSSDDQKMYITTYNLNGQQINEHQFDIKDDSQWMYSYENFVIVEDDLRLYILDTKKGTLKEVVDIQRPDNFITMDFMYKNDTLYVMTTTEEAVTLEAYRNHNLVYRGNIQMTKMKNGLSSEGKSIQTFYSFKRGSI